jgi:DNA-binding beta-propeller fold protein YncE
MSIKKRLSHLPDMQGKELRKEFNKRNTKDLEQKEAHANDLLATRAWEAKDSPADLGYRSVPDWGQLPAGWVLGQVAGVEADSANRVYVFHRGQEAPPLLCFDADGTYLFPWEHISFGRPHMVTCDTEDNVWLSDDGDHIIYKLSPRGEILFTLGTKGVPGEDGTHFDQPTDIAFNVQGEMYVSDGYGNKRIAKFDPQGNFILQWGSKGEAPGQFALPHAIAIDGDGLVYVADRENWRVQIFDPDGTFLRQWTHIGRPSDLTYIASEGCFYICDAPNHRVTKVSASGKVLGFFEEPGDGIHDIAYSPNGDIIVGLLSGSVKKFTKR